MKDKIMYERLSVMNTVYCECGGDWLNAIILLDQFQGKKRLRKAWICDNCGALYKRENNLPSLVIEENLEAIEI